MRFLILFSIALMARGQGGAPVEVRSPDGRVVVQVEVKERPVYRVSIGGEPRILDSGLGLVLDGAAPLVSFLRVENVRHSQHRGEWRPVYGERSVVPDRYNEAVVDLVETIPPRRRLSVVVRAYDEGVALRYHMGGTEVVSIAGEATEFALPPGAQVWETHGTQSVYQKVAVDELKPNSERPMMVEFAGGGFGAIAEAGMHNYSTMLLSRAPRKSGVLAVSLAGPVRLTAPLETPWRVILLAGRPGELLEHNYLLQNLCPPSRVADTSWIRPGKVLREVTLSTKGAHEAVDFAARRGLQYIEFDAGWYGYEYNDDSDATRVSVDPLRLQKDPAYQGLDLREVIRYAKSKGVGVLVYVNRRALERQIDQVLPLLARWGVSGVKYGFVNVGSQQWTRWLYSAVEKAAAHHLMVDIHDEFRPTGMSRTWPNLLTQEGIRGNEEFPDATHNTVMPFTRFLAGAADYTICWTDARLKNSAAHQLALSVVYYSPFQFVYWYDRPVNVKEDDPALGMLDRVPTVWDETRVLDGRPGEFAVVARRSGQRWFVGAITNTSARTLTVPLDFLPAGRQVEARVYRDGASAREVVVETKQVDSSSRLELKLAASGGAAVELP